MKIAIISHTEHYINANGVIAGWGPTVREINYIAKSFEKIIHIACLHSGDAPKSALEYDQDNIAFIPLPPTGGDTIIEKLNVIVKAPQVIKKILSVIDEVDAVQLRVPTGMANYLLPWLTFRAKKNKIWIKYAGNWNQINPPLGYTFQRWWLATNKMKSVVTINGKWPDQPPHCLTFENPCLDEQERSLGAKLILSRKYDSPYTACFVGRVEEAKGIGRIIDALPVLESKGIVKIHVVGDGPQRLHYEEQARQSKSSIELIFHQQMARNDLAGLFEKSHLLFLPSTASEGFPKVIAEAANYGCVPLVSNISSIGQYIGDDNGYLWDTSSDFKLWLNHLEIVPEELKRKAQNAYKFANAFTFKNYLHRLKTEILPS